jgi:1,4-alpha-glucan branching enzyme
MKKVEQAKKRVSFYLRMPDAKEVYLAGDFNNWDASSLPLSKDSRGAWRKTLTLSKGQYQYRYIVDGKWYTDPNKEQCPNPFGGQNNVLKV